MVVVVVVVVVVTVAVAVMFSLFSLIYVVSGGVGRLLFLSSLLFSLGGRVVSVVGHVLAYQQIVSMLILTLPFKKG